MKCRFEELVYIYIYMYIEYLVVVFLTIVGVVWQKTLDPTVTYFHVLAC